MPPANEVQTRAQGDQVGEMAEQKPGVFDKAAFVASVRKAIADAAPKNMDEADRIKDSGKACQVKQAVRSGSSRCIAIFKMTAIG